MASPNTKCMISVFLYHRRNWREGDVGRRPRRRPAAGVGGCCTRRRMSWRADEGRIPLVWNWPDRSRRWPFSWCRSTADRRTLHRPLVHVYNHSIRFKKKDVNYFSNNLSVYYWNLIRILRPSRNVNESLFNWICRLSSSDQLFQQTVDKQRYDDQSSRGKQWNNHKIWSELFMKHWAPIETTLAY